jgi:hypothetical protein
VCSTLGGRSLLAKISTKASSPSVGRRVAAVAQPEPDLGREESEGKAGIRQVVNVWQIYGEKRE